MRVRFLGAVITSATAASALAAPALDGSRDASYGAPVSIQTNETQFGDNFSELDAAYTRVEGGNLYLMLTGNLENNFNKLNVFIDSVAGGENQLTNDVFNGGQNPTNDGWAGKYAGFRFDTGFAADRMIIMRNGNAGGDRFDIDFAQVGSGGPFDFEAAGDVFGGSQQGSNNGALPINSIGVAFNNSNVGGVGGAAPGAANAAAAAAVSTGIELRIPLAALGNPADPTQIKISAMINGSNHDYLSNQFLGGLDVRGNLGGDGSGGFNGTVGQLDMNNYPGNQYFNVSIPEPSTLGLLALAGLAAFRRK